MEICKMVSTKEDALRIWEKREYFNLSNFTFSDLINIFLNTDNPHRLFSRKRHYDDFFVTFQNVQIRELSFSVLQKWFSKIQKNYNLTERTLKMIKSQLNPFFKWAMNENIIQANPLERIKFRGNLPPKKPRAILSQQEIMKIIADAKSFDEQTFYPFIFAIIHTGARRSEIMNLRWENVDLDEGFLTFHKTKNGESRKIRMSHPLWELVRNKTQKEHFVFLNHQGNQLIRAYIQRLINDFKQAFPQKQNFNYHDLRHSFAFNFLKKGGEMYHLKAILGHKTIQMTVDLYGNLKSCEIENPSPYSN